MQSRHKWSLGVVTGFACLTTAFMVYQAIGRATRRAPASLGIGMREIPFYLTGLEKKERARGHPDFLGVHGRNAYRFEGTVDFGQSSLPIITTDYEPRSLVEVNESYYLLCRHAFADYKFRWFMSDGRAPFVAIDGTGIPVKLWDAQFTGDLNTFFYRGWLIRELARTCEPSTVAECFGRLTETDPRFIYQRRWREPGKRMGPVDFFRDYVAATGQVALYDDILTLVLSSESSDDCQVIAFACSTLLKLNHDRAVEDICRFRAKVKAEDVPGDTRLLSFPGIESLRKLNCQGQKTS